MAFLFPHHTTYGASRPGDGSYHEIRRNAQHSRRLGSIRCSSSASSARRRPQNVEGDFFVDNTCIDCDVCRWMAPKSFKRVGGQSAVYNQPTTSSERVVALQALLSCPTSSIHTENPPADILQVHSTFPIPIDDKSLPGVFHCGHHSEKSFAAASYFIKRPGGNILIDSPRFSERLAKNLEKMGGVNYIFLTHRDDVADHDRWQKRFNCTRILHEKEVNAGTVNVEIKLKGSGPWEFLGPDIDLVFTPGHTEACVCLYLKPSKVLFTGDHLGSTSEGHLHVDPNFNWYSVDLQMENIKALLPLDFVWILPGHGRRSQYASVEEKNKAINDLIARMYEKA